MLAWKGVARPLGSHIFIYHNVQVYVEMYFSPLNLPSTYWHVATSVKP